MKDLIIKILKEHSTYLDRSRSYEGIYDEQFDYVADALMKQFAISGVVGQSEQLHSCNYVKRIGESCTLNNNCKYPNCE